MLQNELLWYPCGCLRSHFLMLFGIRAPGGAQDGSRGSPRGVQSQPKYQLLMIFDRFRVEIDVISDTFGWSRECPSHKSEYTVSKFGQHSPLLLKSARVHVDI